MGNRLDLLVSARTCKFSNTINELQWLQNKSFRLKFIEYFEATSRPWPPEPSGQAESANADYEVYSDDENAPRRKKKLQVFQRCTEGVNAQRRLTA